MALPRTLTVFCVSGLSNRLRVLVSGLAVAEASGRTFRMLWPRTSRCAAAFRELFANDWPVTDVDALDPCWNPYAVEGWSPRTQDLLADPRTDIVLGVSMWLINLEDASRPALHTRCVELMAKLEPIPTIRDRVATFRTRHFRPTMIGVHLRRGDFLRHRPGVAGNTREVLAVLDGFLAGAPDAGIVLCTDDGATDPGTGRVRREGVGEIFQARYGERVVHTSPRSLDRRTVAGVQDGLVDLLLLRTTQIVVGTAGSSFSALAVFGRAIPHASVTGGTPGYRRLDPLLRLTGVRWLVRRLGRAVYGPVHPVPNARQRLLRPLKRWTKRTLKL